MKVTFLGQQSIFSSESRLPIDGFSWNVIPRTFRACATHGIRLVAMEQKLSHFSWSTKYLTFCISASSGGITLKNHILQSPRMRFELREFGCDRSITKGTLHGKQYFFVCLGLQWSYLILCTSDRNEGHFTWRAKYLFLCISGTSREILLKPHTAQSSRMHYKPCKFGCNRSIMKGTLRGKQRTFSSLSRLAFHGFSDRSKLALFTHALQAILRFVEIGTNEQSSFSSLSRLPIEIFFFMKRHTAHSPRMRYRPCKFGCDPSIMKGAVHWEWTNFRLYLCFHSMDFREIS